VPGYRSRGRAQVNPKAHPGHPLSYTCSVQGYRSTGKAQVNPRPTLIMYLQCAWVQVYRQGSGNPRPTQATPYHVPAVCQGTGLQAGPGTW